MSRLIFVEERVMKISSILFCFNAHLSQKGFYPFLTELFCGLKLLLEGVNTPWTPFNVTYARLKAENKKMIEGKSLHRERVRNQKYYTHYYTPLWAVSFLQIESSNATFNKA